jgi:hypothetical protein
MAITVKTLPQKGFTIEVKRLNLPFVLESACPKCKKIAVYDLSVEYFLYPALGEPEEIYFGCDGCAEEWAEHCTLEVVIKPVETSK